MFLHSDSKYSLRNIFRRIIENQDGNSYQNPHKGAACVVVSCLQALDYKLIDLEAQSNITLCWEAHTKNSEEFKSFSFMLTFFLPAPFARSNPL